MLRRSRQEFRAARRELCRMSSLLAPGAAPRLGTLVALKPSGGDDDVRNVGGLARGVSWWVSDDADPLRGVRSLTRRSRRDAVGKAGFAFEAWRPVGIVPLHSTSDASSRTAWLLGRIQAVFSLVSLRRGTLPTDYWVCRLIEYQALPRRARGSQRERHARLARARVRLAPSSR